MGFRGYFRPIRDGSGPWLTRYPRFPGVRGALTGPAGPGSGRGRWRVRTKIFEKIFFAQKHFFWCSESKKSVFERKNFFHPGHLAATPATWTPKKARKQPKKCHFRAENRKMAITFATRGVGRQTDPSFPPKIWALIDL